MHKIFPPKLKKGDEVRIIAPARSLSLPWINEELKERATKRLEELGLRVTFGEHVNEIDEFDSSSIEHRIEDLHNAFLDENVRLVLTVIGGFNSNQLLSYLDYDLIRDHPTLLCGYSDITALANAIHAKTGLVTYSGPHYFSFGEKNGFDHTLEHFKKCLFSEGPFELLPSEAWSDDRWANAQDDRTFTRNDGYWVLQEGEAEGTIIGGNQCTLNLLHGTEFMPDVRDSVLFIEDDDEAHVRTIDRDLQSIIHQPGFEKVRGIVFGRFQPKTGMTRELLAKIVATKKELGHLPIIANADFGHTTPLITFPIGGSVEMRAKKDAARIVITDH